MELTVFMTNKQANFFRTDSQFHKRYFDGIIYAHYLKYEHSTNNWNWTGWDAVSTISRKDLPQLTYEQLISLPTPITLTELKSLYPEYFI